MDVTGVDSRICVGQIVQVKTGREAGAYAVVIGLEEPHFVWLADGKKRMAEKPKRKNQKHVQPTIQVAQEVVSSLQVTGRVTNALLRYALNQYLLQIRSEEQKGV
ncbi:ribosomal protein L14E/L6E/L27E [Croceifilum oryzae]|uniref:Ribosomal protein L14E/L6E/L27E n=1 Tax=Croceifilum oryzae TaxID=1553429 RepID=A0AAJ1TPH0_9BACL|nr:KOW domain-containing RNA-binding protein [Croceifilum oryzae]MDQ0418186.1 ribosomal protein L14E/L6E/L27E [Croceifilum oryzae]